jgi:uncharacterized protein (TIGR02246 family)
LARLAEQAAPLRARFATPEATVRTFAAALRAGNLEAMTDCFTLECCLVTPDATAVSGRGAVRGVLAQLVSQRAEIAIESSGAVTAGDLAFVNQRWRIAVGRGGEHAQVEEVVPVLVLRDEDSEWKLAIAAPWGRP